MSFVPVTTCWTSLRLKLSRPQGASVFRRGWGPCPSSRSNHLAKLKVSHGGPACPPVTLRAQMSRFRMSSFRMFPCCLWMARSIEIGMISLFHDLHCARSAKRRWPLYMMMKYFVPKAKGRGIQSWPGSHSLISLRSFCSKSKVSLPTWCNFISPQSLTVTARPPFPGGKRPICFHSSNSCKEGVDRSGSCSCRNSSTCFSSSCLHALQILSSYGPKNPFWCITTPFFLSCRSNSCACSLVIGRYLLQCQIQQSVVPICKWRSNLVLCERNVGRLDMPNRLHNVSLQSSCHVSAVDAPPTMLHLEILRYIHHKNSCHVHEGCDHRHPLFSSIPCSAASHSLASHVCKAHKGSELWACVLLSLSSKPWKVFWQKGQKGTTSQDHEGHPIPPALQSHRSDFSSTAHWVWLHATMTHDRQWGDSVRHLQNLKKKPQPLDVHQLNSHRRCRISSQLIETQVGNIVPSSMRICKLW